MLSRLDLALSWLVDHGDKLAILLAAIVGVWRHFRHTKTVEERDKEREKLKRIEEILTHAYEATASAARRTPFTADDKIAVAIGLAARGLAQYNILLDSDLETYARRFWTTLHAADTKNGVDDKSLAAKALEAPKP